MRSLGVEDAGELRVRVVEDDLQLVADVHVVEAQRRDRHGRPSGFTRVPSSNDYANARFV